MKHRRFFEMQILCYNELQVQMDSHLKECFNDKLYNQLVIKNL